MDCKRAKETLIGPKSTVSEDYLKHQKENEIAKQKQFVRTFFEFVLFEDPHLGKHLWILYFCMGSGPAHVATLIYMNEEQFKVSISRWYYKVKVIILYQDEFII